MHEISKKDYQKLSGSVSKKSPIVKDTAFAFLIGGGICALGEVFYQIYFMLNSSKDLSLALTSVTLIFISAVLTMLGIYDKIARFGGAGTLVPITGFANSIVSPAMEFRPEGFILGVGVKMFSIAGPVLSYGALASFILGFAYYLTEVLK